MYFYLRMHTIRIENTKKFQEEFSKSDLLQFFKLFTYFLFIFFLRLFSSFCILELKKKKIKFYLANRLLTSVHFVEIEVGRGVYYISSLETTPMRSLISLKY
ncbi:hypothetical protein V6Z12_A10G152900 [Gossypium hirsutum]